MSVLFIPSTVVYNWKQKLKIHDEILSQFAVGQIKIILRNWDTSTSSQVSNCDGVMLEIYLDHKFQWPQEGLNCESLAYDVVT